MRLSIKVIIGMILISVLISGCDLMEVNEKNQDLNQENSQNLSKSFFTVADLSETGLKSATDINDRGDIVGGNYVWENSLQFLFELNFKARAINNSGQVVGENKYWDSTHGSTTIEGMNDGHVVSSLVLAYDINDNGDVVGEVNTCYNQNTSDGGCEYDFWSMQWDSDTGHSEYFGYFSFATSINALGDVTGSSIEAPSHSIYLEKPQFNFDLGPFEGYGYGKSYSINNNVQIVGTIELIQNQKSYLNSKADITNQNKQRDQLRCLKGNHGLYDYGHLAQELYSLDSKANKLDLKQGENNSKLTGLNWDELTTRCEIDSEKQIVDLVLSSSYKSEAFIWDQDSGFESLGTLGGDWSTAFDINDHGQVVGYSDIGNDEYRAFYWDNENGMLELPSNGKNSIARAINNKGQIVGENEGPVMWEVRIEN